MINNFEFRTSLRNSYRKVRKKLSPNFQSWSSQEVFQQIKKLSVYQNAKQIALYRTTQGEIDLMSLWKDANRQNKKTFFPVLDKQKQLSFLEANPEDEFKVNHFGILEPYPIQKNILIHELLDIIFVPLVCFDLAGTRLGMGKGYYDRTLTSKKNTLLIGVAYDFQHYPYIEPQSWDIPLDLIVTPAKIHWVSKPCVDKPINLLN